MLRALDVEPHSLIHSCIHLFTSLFSCSVVINVPSSILGTKDTAMNATKSLLSYNLHSGREIADQQIHI